MVSFPAMELLYLGLAPLAILTYLLIRSLMNMADKIDEVANLIYEYNYSGEAPDRILAEKVIKLIEEQDA